MNGQSEQSEKDIEELPVSLQRAVGIIRDGVGVRWPAGHVELALIRLQRRRQQRRTAVAGATLSVTGVALAFALGFGGYLRDELAASGLMPAASSATASSIFRSRPTPVPASVAGSSAKPAREGGASSVVIPTPITVHAEPAHEGHLLQQRLVPRRQVAAGRWVTLASERRFGEAYGLLRRVPLRDLSDPDDLMLAADVARQAGRPDRAVPFLERVVKEHPSEVSAQLAGFSLGKIYLDNLGAPALAARSFAAVRAMAPGGGLAQDALAREVEAWSRAGESGRARDAALDYSRLYPRGRRLAAVRDLGGI
ncbi:MAG TPA: hypothetical protein VMT47_05955 [Polyangia bacterium]|nr:hypothetical protein [Polyangia bacterium]